MVDWNSENSAMPAGAGAVTLLAGTTFCISAANGDIQPGRPHGIFFRDTRFLSQWTLAVDGRPLEPMGTESVQSYRATHIGRATRGDGVADTHLLVERHRLLDGGIQEEIVVRNFSAQASSCTVEIEVHADFADLLDVKAWRRPPSNVHRSIHSHGALRMESWRRGHHREVTIQAPGARIGENALSYHPQIPAQGQWSTTISITPSIDRIGPESDVTVGEQNFPSSIAEHRMLAWQGHTPVAKVSSASLSRCLEQSHTDLGSLRIFDPRHPGRIVIAAGAPWYMALFGRDSLIASYMALPLDPMLALGTLETLAEFQGRERNPNSEEQPGRILHEVRLGAPSTATVNGGVYYGSADATPLFVVLAGELVQWGYQHSVLHQLLPSIDAALAWICHEGDIDGDGFVEYQRTSHHGLANQGWKDSWDSISFSNGTLASPPLALCEIQGYVYAAYRSRALIAECLGDESDAQTWRSKAQNLKDAFNDRFWIHEKRYFALALDKNKQKVDACASNMGQCLWSGIVDEDKAQHVVDTLLAEHMFSGWGIRTLSAQMGAYNPASYHNGSVWPHDNALIATGLMRYGFIEEAQAIATSLLEAADHFGGRLPEVFCGFDRKKYPVPVPYPTACSPQAWSSATPLQLIRALLQFDPSIPNRTIWVNPALPESMGSIRVSHLPLAGKRFAMEIYDGQSSISGLPRNIKVQHGSCMPDVLRI